MKYLQETDLYKNDVNVLMTVFLSFIDCYSILLCNIPFSNNGLKKKKKLNEKLPHFCFFKKVDDECELAQNVLWYYLAWEPH